MICMAEDGQRKELFNKNRAAQSSACPVSGENSAMSFREKPSPKIFSIMFSVWVVTDWLFFSRCICERLNP